MVRKFSYRGYQVRIQLLRLGTKYRARYRLDDGDWIPAIAQDGSDWAVDAAEAAARERIDGLMLPPTPEPANPWQRLAAQRLTLSALGLDWARERVASTAQRLVRPADRSRHAN